MKLVLVATSSAKRYKIKKDKLTGVSNNIAISGAIFSTLEYKGITQQLLA